MADDDIPQGAPQDDPRRQGGVPFAESGLIDHMGLRDDVEVVLNPAGADAEQTALLQGGTYEPTPPLPDRPADTASKAEWVGYVEALGGDPRFAQGESEHWTGVGYAKATGLTRDELQHLADWLGG